MSFSTLFERKSKSEWLLWILNGRDNSNTRHSIQCETFIRMLQSVIWCRCVPVTSMLIPYHSRYEKQLKTNNHVNWPKNVARNPGKGIKDWKNIKHWITSYIDCLKQNGYKYFKIIWSLYQNRKLKLNPQNMHIWVINKIESKYNTKMMGL